MGYNLAMPLKALEWSQSAFARFMGRNPRSVRRWCSGDPEPPMEAVMLLAVMLEYGITVQRLEHIKQSLSGRLAEDAAVDAVPRNKVERRDVNLSRGTIRE